MFSKNLTLLARVRSGQLSKTNLTQTKSLLLVPTEYENCKHPLWIPISWREISESNADTFYLGTGPAFVLCVNQHRDSNSGFGGEMDLYRKKFSSCAQWNNANSQDKLPRTPNDSLHLH